MSQLLLVGNPAKRRRSTHKRAPSAAQRRQRARFAKMAKSGAFHKRQTRSNPAKHRAVVHHRKHAVRHHRHVRRNPAPRATMTGIVNQLKGAAFAAAGALGVDVGFGFIASYLPANMQTETDTAGVTNYTYYAAKGAAAVGLGMLLKRAIGANKAAQVVHGSLTVTMHNLAANFLKANVPSIPLGMYARPPALRGMNPARAATVLPIRPGLQQYLGGGRAPTPPHAGSMAQREAFPR